MQTWTLCVTDDIIDTRQTWTHCVTHDITDAMQTCKLNSFLTDYITDTM